MNHQLENAVPHQAVVQGGRTAAPLKPRPGLGGDEQGVKTNPRVRGAHVPLIS